MRNPCCSKDSDLMSKQRPKIWTMTQKPDPDWFLKTYQYHYSLKIIWSTCSMTWSAYEPLILCLSCDKWSCGTYQNCWKEWNALIWQRCCRESRYCQSTYTERHMWDKKLFNFRWVANTKIMIMFLTSNSTNTKHISGELFSCKLCIQHTWWWLWWYAFRWKSNRNSLKWFLIFDPLPKLQITFNISHTIKEIIAISQWRICIWLLVNKSDMHFVFTSLLKQDV